MKNILLIAVLSLGLAGCAGALPWNDQENAGLTDVTFYWGYDSDNQTVYPREVRITDGKEAGTIDFKFNMPDGTILNFTGTDVRAFEGQRLRAELEAAVAAEFGDVSKAFMDGLMTVVTGGTSEILPEILGNGDDE